MEPETKSCSKCDMELPLSAFHRNCSTRDKRHTACKACRCSYAALTTDLQQKNARARQTYELARCHIKAKRIALMLLSDVERCIADTPCCAVHAIPSSTAQQLLRAYVSSETLTCIANMLSAHLGQDAYWTGFNIRWRLQCKDFLPPSLRDMADREGYIRHLLRPSNIVFQSIY